jgi:hypothetical protein
MIDIEPVRHVNGNGRVRWQPQLNGERLYGGFGWSVWRKPGRSFFVAVLTSYRRAKRHALRELQRQQANNWREEQGA